MAFLINLLFTMVEIVGGFMTGSVAILADAVHDLGDTMSLAFAFFLQRFSARGRDDTYSYGYSRFSLLSALISGLTMLLASVFVIQKIWERFNEPRTPHALGMLGLAVLGVAANSWAALKLGKGETQNEKILRWHLWEDVVGWGGILIGSILIHLQGWTWVDPVLAVALSAFVMWNIVKNLRDTLKLFLQGKPENFSQDLFLSQVKALSGVHDVHDLHVWSLDGAKNILSLHVVVRDDEKNISELKRSIARIAQDQGHFHLTIETEIAGEECRENCEDDKKILKEFKSGG